MLLQLLRSARTIANATATGILIAAAVIVPVNATNITFVLLLMLPLLPLTLIAYSCYCHYAVSTAAVTEAATKCDC